MIALIDYGAGNVGSVLKAVRHLGFSARAMDSPRSLDQAEKIILPGVGHFGAMMKALQERGLLEPLSKWVSAGKPFLGICLGLQALYQGSEEAPEVAGLGYLPGRVRRLEGIFKVPHVGWSPLQVRKSEGLLAGIKDASYVYYCHSYCAPESSVCAALTEYGVTYAAAIESGAVVGVQFHPEKSGDVGLQVLQNFLVK